MAPGSYVSGVFGWTGTGFVQVAPAPGGFSGWTDTACCDARGRVFVVRNELQHGLGALLVLEGGQWRSVVAGNGNVRRLGCMTTTPGHGLLFTGGYQANAGRFDGTAHFDGRRWTWSLSAPTPLRGHAACAGDPLGRGVVLFGGEATTGNPFGYAVRDDTWLWDGSQWQLHATGGPGARSLHAMTLDAARQRVVMSGGLWGAGAQYFLPDTWEWDGATWTRVADLPRPLARHAMAYDSARGRTVLFGGQNLNGLHDETLEWDGTAWLQRAAAWRPPPGHCGLAYDPDRGLTTLVISTATATTTWHWDGAVWANDPVDTPPCRYLQMPALFAGGPQVVWHGALRRVLYHDGLHLHALSATPAGVSPLGSGCGAGRLTLATPARPAGELRLDVLGAPAGSPVAVGVSLASGNVPLGGGCSLLLQNGLGAGLATASPAGFAALAFAIPPAPALRGLTVFVQAAHLDPGSALGLALTAAVSVTVGD